MLNVSGVWVRQYLFNNLNPTFDRMLRREKSRYHEVELLAFPCNFPVRRSIYRSKVEINLRSLQLFNIRSAGSTKSLNYAVRLF